MEDGRKKKLGLKPPGDSAIPPLGIYLEETKTEKKNPMSSNVHCSTLQQLDMKAT